MAAALPWLTWMWLETGAPYPTTATAKAAFFAEWAMPLQTKLSYAFAGFMSSGLLFLFAGLVGLPRTQAGWCGLLFIVVFLISAILVIPGSLGWNDYRYLAVTIPVAIYGLAGLAETLTGTLLLGLLLVASTYSGLKSVRVLHAEQAGNAASIAAINAQVARTETGATIMIHDAGMVAWGNPHAHLLDVVGLKTPSSIAFHQRYTKRSCRWNRALDGIAKSGDASYVLVLEQPVWSCVRTNLEGVGWRFLPVGGTGIYRLYRLRPPIAGTTDSLRR